MTEEIQTQETQAVETQSPEAENNQAQKFDPNSDEPVKLAEYTDGSEKSEDNVEAEKAGWYYAEGIPGKGERPEWLTDKYPTVADMAKHAGGLRKKLAGFTGAPEEYEISVSKELPEEVDLNPEDPLLKDFMAFAKESNMSQSYFDKVIDMYMGHAKEAFSGDEKEAQEYYQTQLKELGDDGKDQIRVLEQWGENNLPEELKDVFKNSVTDAKQVKLFNYIRNLTRYTDVPGNAQSGQSLTHEDLKARMNDRRYWEGGEYAKKTNEMYEKFFSE